MKRYNRCQENVESIVQYQNRNNMNANITQPYVLIGNAVTMIFCHHIFFYLSNIIVVADNFLC